MQFQCGEENVPNNAKEFNSREQIVYHISLPICHDACQEIKRWAVPKCLRFSNPQPNNSSYSHTWCNRQRGKKAYVKKNILISFNLQCFNCLDCWVFLKDKKGWWKEECMFHPHACVTKKHKHIWAKPWSMILMWCYINYGDLVPCLFVGILGSKVDIQMVFASCSICGDIVSAKHRESVYNTIVNLNLKPF
jgi:hypothetical protein